MTYFLITYKPYFAWQFGRLGGILLTHSPQLICTSMLDCARVATSPTWHGVPSYLAVRIRLHITCTD